MTLKAMQLAERETSLLRTHSSSHQQFSQDAGALFRKSEVAILNNTSLTIHIASKNLSQAAVASQGSDFS